MQVHFKEDIYDKLMKLCREDCVHPRDMFNILINQEAERRQHSKANKYKSDLIDGESNERSSKN